MDRASADLTAAEKESNHCHSGLTKSWAGKERTQVSEHEEACNYSKNENNDQLLKDRDDLYIFKQNQFHKELTNIQLMT